MATKSDKNKNENTIAVLYGLYHLKIHVQTTAMLKIATYSNWCATRAMSEALGLEFYYTVTEPVSTGSLV